MLRVLPRAVLQTAFYASLGRLTAGEAGLTEALTGAVAFLAVGPLVVRLPDIGTEERFYGTMGRLLTGRPPIAALLAARTWPYLAEALAIWAIAGCLTPLLLARPELADDQLTALPAYLLIMAATTAMGLVVTSTCLGRRSEVAVSNTLAYATLALGGVLPTAAGNGPLSAAADLLPFTPALQFYRAQQAGHPGTTLLLHTLLLSAAWATAAWLIARTLTRRSVRDGHHDLT
ncbi:hypothetical protein [Kitasatospora sp. NPDC085879]|uniref:hypothetical protein n=1 Tax=Kitasatospora sp. NPDC085879 TaxID=3154769 RepID=UPI00343486B8